MHMSKKIYFKQCCFEIDCMGKNQTIVLNFYPLTSLSILEVKTREQEMENISLLAYLIILSKRSLETFVSIYKYPFDWMAWTESKFARTKNKYQNTANHYELIK